MYLCFNRTYHCEIWDLCGFGCVLSNSVDNSSQHVFHAVACAHGSAGKHRFPRLFSREATFSFVGFAFADVISDADKGKSRFARKKSPSGKRALDPVYTMPVRNESGMKLLLFPNLLSSPHDAGTKSTLVE